jgi:hypothetical protein
MMATRLLIIAKSAAPGRDLRHPFKVIQSVSRSEVRLLQFGQSRIDRFTEQHNLLPESLRPL